MGSVESKNGGRPVIIYQNTCLFKKAKAVPTMATFAIAIAFLQPGIHINLKHATRKITNNTHSNKYTTRYSKLDGNYGTREHIKIGNKVQ
jgi:hypothetical protein